jgi:hypothetical protein
MPPLSSPHCSTRALHQRSPPLLQPIPATELPLTAEESSFLRDARIVPTVAEAESASKSLPEYGEGEYAETKGKEGGEVDQAVEEAVGSEIEGEKEKGVDVKQGEESVKAGAEKKGWFGWGK